MRTTRVAACRTPPVECRVTASATGSVHVMISPDLGIGNATSLGLRARLSSTIEMQSEKPVPIYLAVQNAALQVHWSAESFGYERSHGYAST